jgi:hypothetical protein
VLATGKVLVVKNCAELGAKVEIGSVAEQEKNSWLSPFVVTTDDLRSTDASAAYGPRKDDGSLPHIEYLHLAAGSDLIDAGVNVGLPFMGMAPDLGCFETGLTGIYDIRVSGEFICYPNPVSDRGFLQFTLGKGGRCEIWLFDVTGRHVKTLMDRTVEPGEQDVGIDISGLRNGLYICQIKMENVPVLVARIVKTDSGK